MIALIKPITIKRALKKEKKYQKLLYWHGTY